MIELRRMSRIKHTQCLYPRCICVKPGLSSRDLNSAKLWEMRNKSAINIASFRINKALRHFGVCLPTLFETGDLWKRKLGQTRTTMTEQVCCVTYKIDALSFHGLPCHFDRELSGLVPIPNIKPHKNVIAGAQRTLTYPEWAVNELFFFKK